VAKSDVFLDFVEQLSTAVMNSPGLPPQDLLKSLAYAHPGGPANFEEARNLAASKLKESVTVGRVETGQGLRYGQYVHGCLRPGIGLKASLVGLEVAGSPELETLAEVGDTLALQVLGLVPEYNHLGDVPPGVLAQWTERIREEMKDRLGKVKPEVAEKMVQGRLRKAFLQEKVLECMPLLSDPDGNLDVQNYLRLHNLELRVASRWVWQV
jgi:translation elongation factor EF-Ts